MKERRGYFKSEAKFMLRYNYLRQIFMAATVVLITAGLNSVRDYFIDIINLDEMKFILPARIFFDILIFMLVIPVFLGIVHVSRQLYKGERIPVGGMFEFFKSPLNFMNSLKFMFAIGIRWITFLMPFLLFGALISYVQAPLYLTYPDAVNLDIIMLCISLVYFIGKITQQTHAAPFKILADIFVN